MDKNQLIELVNKEIDGIISTHEKKMLRQIIAENTEAKKLFDALHNTTQILGASSEIEPPVNLKNDVINEIKRKTVLSNHLKKKSSFGFMEWLFRPKPRLAFTFSLGIIFGLLIGYIIIEENFTGNLNQSDMSATIAAKNINSIEHVSSIPVSRSDISGTVDFYRDDDLLWIETRMISAGTFNLTIIFDSVRIKFNKYFVINESSDNFHHSKNNIEIKFNKTGIGSFVFSVQSPQSSVLKMKLNFSDETVLEKEIHVDGKIF